MPNWINDPLSVLVTFLGHAEQAEMSPPPAFIPLRTVRHIRRSNQAAAARTIRLAMIDCQESEAMSGAIDQ